MVDDQGDDVASPSDVTLLQMGCALSEACTVSARCSSCGSHSLEVPDGVRYLVAKAFAAGYRLRELGRDGCSEWLARSTEGATVGPLSSPGSLAVASDAILRDRDGRSDRPCELGLGEGGGGHAYASSDGRLWACPCGSWIIGTRVVFAWPGSPLDGQAHVVTDAQLEELGRAGLSGVETVLESVRQSDASSAERRS